MFNVIQSKRRTKKYIACVKHFKEIEVDISVKHQQEEEANFSIKDYK